MSDESYEAALEDLATDSGAWGDLATTYGEVRTLVNSCDLVKFEMDGAGKMSGAEDNYRGAFEDIRDLVKSAEEVFGEISQQLLDTKSNYEGANGYAQWMLEQG